MSNQDTEVFDGEVVEAGASTALATYEGGSGLAVTTDELNRMVQLDEQRRGIISSYIGRNLKAGVDYGEIPNVSRGKKSLFKPGAEKICMLLQMRATFQPDHATLAMAGNQPGLFAYICYLTGRDGLTWGEGRGSADLGEKRGWTVNNAVKIAEKRAMIDAVLRVAAMSELFTQDIEDASQRGSMQEQPVVRNGRQNGAQEQQGGEAADIMQEQIAEINRLLPLVGMSIKDLLDSLAIKSLRELSAPKALRVIERLKAKVPQAPTTPTTDTAPTTPMLIEQQRVRLKLGATDWKALVRARNGGRTLEQLQPGALVAFLSWLATLKDTDAAKAFMSGPDAWYDQDHA